MAVQTASFIAPEIVSGTTTIWLPLTSAHPQVQGCASAFFQYPGQPVYAWDPGYGYFAGGSLSCLPPVATTWWEQGHHGEDPRTVISIQPITCPQSWSTVATEVRDTSSTLVKCCPPDYTLVNPTPGRIDGNCKSALRSGQVLTYTSSDATVSLTSTVSATSQSINAIPIIGYNVARASTGSSGAMASPTSTSTNLSSPSSTLSPGASAGIGVGAALCIIAIASLIFLLMRRKRPHRSEPLKSQDLLTQDPMMHPPIHAASAPVYEMNHGSQKHNYYSSPAELQAR